VTRLAEIISLVEQAVPADSWSLKVDEEERRAKPALRNLIVRNDAVSRTAFVKYDDDGFWAYDVALSIFLKHLIDAAESRADEPETGWLREEVASWRVIAGPCQGQFGLPIKQSWSQAQREFFVELARQACDLMAKGERWSAEEVASWPILDDARIHPRVAQFISTAPVVELGQAIVGLAQSTLPEPPPGTWWLFGTPRGRDTIRKRE
jgi:hypothetical protein